MGAIKKHKRSLASGEQRTYIYEVNGGKRRSLGIVNSSDSGSVSPKLYRTKEKNRIVAALQANVSLLVIGEQGCGKSVLLDFVTKDLETIGFQVVVVRSSTTKVALLRIARQLGIETLSLSGKVLKVEELQEAIVEFLSENTVFLIIDNAHQLQPSMRYWLEELHDQKQPMVLSARYPPARDIFLKLPRIELQPLSDLQIREIMKEAAAARGIELTNAQLAYLQQRCGGNPMLAERVITEEYAGLDETNPDHTQWVDGTPYLIAGLTLFVIVRFVGLGFNSTSLYLIGAILTVFVAAIKVLFHSLPRKSGRLGQ